MKVSVLICTYKRPNLLEECLHSLIEDSEILPDEIVIVDGENGQIKDIIYQWQKKFSPIVLVPTKNINLAAARNKGLPFCSGEVIAFSDDDIKVSPNWIKKIRELHNHYPEISAIGGKVESLSQRFRDRIADLVIFPAPKKPQRVETLAGANISYKKNTIKEVGYFDEELFRGEDVDYNWRILKKGGSIYYDPELLVYHRHRNSWRGLFYQLFMYGRAYYLVRRKWEDIYCIYPRKFNTLKDLLKVFYFFGSVIYQAFLDAKKVDNVYFGIIAYPVLIGCQLVWRIGMISQYLKTKFKKN
ncbi:MAG: glycosyltransferase [Candidatus Omnitrophica bacterium]|jgi:GT2 family glycosyltransferase|nr:glycosyltransferase [Candidatus Omnitrophota bacterium]